MIIKATCASCGKEWKSVHLALPATIDSDPNRITPTLNNCSNCGARGARLSEVVGPDHDAL